MNPAILHPRIFAATLATCGVIGTLAGVARAEATVNGEPAASEGHATGADAPKGSTGFQFALRTGYAIPLGAFDGGESMSDTFGGQIPFILDIGGKLNPSLFLGAYFGLGVGGTAGALSQSCTASNLSCATATVRYGVEILYGFNPAGSVNPWLGYGIGIEGTAVAISGTRADGTAFTGSLAGSGLEFAHLMGGADFRLGKIFGIGPFVDFSIGQYTHATIDTGTTPKIDGSISNTALHEWLTLGVRGVFWP